MRKRKTKAPCPGCGLHLARCLCADIPRLDFATRLSLLVHAKELKRTTNTGGLAVRALSNSELIVRGEKDVALPSLLRAGYFPLLLYPAEGAQPLTPELARGLPRPVQLLVPDGNWRQAAKVGSRHAELAGVMPVVVGAERNSARPVLRRETRPEGMATLEAIAYALAVLEGERAGRALHALYELKLTRTLAGRPRA